MVTKVNLKRKLKIDLYHFLIKKRAFDNSKALLGKYNNQVVLGNSNLIKL